MKTLYTFYLQTKKLLRNQNPLKHFFHYFQPFKDVRGGKNFGKFSILLFILKVS